MRTLLCFVFLSLGFFLTAGDKKDEEKIDAAKLVGKWKRSEEKGKYPMTLVFRKNGTMTMTITANGDNFELTGSYRVDGNKVVIVLKDDIEHDDVYIVQKLTNTELVWTPEKEKKETFTRIKDE